MNQPLPDSLAHTPTKSLVYLDHAYLAIAAHAILSGNSPTFSNEPVLPLRENHPPNTAESPLTLGPYRRPRFWGPLSSQTVKAARKFQDAFGGGGGAAVQIPPRPLCPRCLRRSPSSASFPCTPPRLQILQNHHHQQLPSRPRRSLGFGKSKASVLRLPAQWRTRERVSRNR